MFTTQFKLLLSVVVLALLLAGVFFVQEGLNKRVDNLEKAVAVLSQPTPKVVPTVAPTATPAATLKATVKLPTPTVKKVR